MVLELAILNVISGKEAEFEWVTLEDHTQGFRGSAQYQEWRALLHHFYDPFPTVEHYECLPSKQHSFPPSKGAL